MMDEKCQQLPCIQLKFEVRTLFKSARINRNQVDLCLAQFFSKTQGKTCMCYDSVVFTTKETCPETSQKIPHFRANQLFFFCLTFRQECISNQKSKLICPVLKYYTTPPRRTSWQLICYHLEKCQRMEKCFLPLVLNLPAASGAHIHVHLKIYIYSFQHLSHMYLVSACDLLFYTEEMNVYIIEVWKLKSIIQGISEEVLKCCGHGRQIFKREFSMLYDVNQMVFISVL